MDEYDVVIVGGGHAGAQTAIALRQLGFAGSVAVLCKEKELPYERPPLSKDYMSGKLDFSGMLLRSAEYWTEQRIAMHLEHDVVAVDPVARRVMCGNGAQFQYGTLVWATGGDARRLACSGGDLAGVHTIRTRGDVDRMLPELAAAKRVIVIGGGYIGLETAAVITEMGKAVVLIEEQDRLLSRVTGEIISRFIEKEHTTRGVDVRLAKSVTRIRENSGKAAGVEVAGGDVIEGDLVIVGVGIVPAVAPLMCAGATAGITGVAVDSCCRTSLPYVFAVGDCAEHANAFADGRRLRLESIQNANDQAMVVARSIVGETVSYTVVPWFWSNQYDLRLQTVGISSGHDQCVLRGDPAARSFCVVYLRGGRVIALDCVNSTKEFIQGKALVTGRVAVDPMRLANPTIPLRDLARPETGERVASMPTRRTALATTELEPN